MEKTCLVIVDMQTGFLNPHTTHLPNAIVRFIENHTFGNIVATQYINTPETACYRLGGWKDCMAHTPEAELVPEIIPYVQRIFRKGTFSGYTPEFKVFLEKERFQKLYFCGVNTDCCVLATMLSCYDNVQDCAVIADLCASTVGEQAHTEVLRLIRENMTPERVIQSYDI